MWPNRNKEVALTEGLFAKHKDDAISLPAFRILFENRSAALVTRGNSDGQFVTGLLLHSVRLQQRRIIRIIRSLTA